MARFLWPFTNTHELNLDWLVQIVRQLQTELSQFVALNTIKYANPFQWNITSQYAQNTLVIDPETGTAYLSLQPVPQGVQIDSTDYWTPVFTLQNFTDALKKAISDFPQQENGQAATQAIPAGTVFWVGDRLVRNDAAIPATSLVIVGSNCAQLDMVSLIEEVYRTPIAVYDASQTAIELGWVRTAPDPSIDAGDVHKYIRAEETIMITGRG